jgi:hypothetical protein
MMSPRSRSWLVLALAGWSGAALADEIPLENWVVAEAPSAGPSKSADASGPRPFVAMQPCRILDTRGNGAPITGGIFANSEARNYTITGICGLPIGSDAVSVNFTVTGSPAAPAGAFLLAWPTGGPTPPVSILNFQAGQTVANAAIVPINSAGQLTINVSHGTHVIMDINGYFSERTAAMGPFRLQVEFLKSPAMIVSNTGACTDTCAISAYTNTPLPGWAIEGTYASPGNGQGVYGHSSGAGPEAAGVYGTGTSAGVLGRVFSDTPNSAAVRGKHESDGAQGIGVWGSHDGSGWGVYGTAAPTGRGVYGQVTGSGIGVRGSAGAGGIGVYFTGGLAGTGTKSFIEPHPTDAALAIQYVSLEGPEAGTYFRGKGKFQRGMATIAVPDTFRMVTAEEGLSVQITPIGGMATFGVVRLGLDEIVVQGSRDLEFFYLVHGVRKAYANWDPIVSSETSFRPETRDQRLPDNLSDDERARLIANGTYTPDGKVNAETARKLGWDRAWAK